jgi:glucan phosphoethanolaminetransferase (alkaline phosphatase superfamily)
MLGDWRTSTEWYGQSLGVMGIMAQSVLLVATSLWLIHNFCVPVGSFTFFFTLFALLTTITSFIPQFIVAFVTTGILLDVLYQVLKPSAARKTQLYSFGFLIPVIFWSAFYAYAFATNLKGGVWYTNYIWMGSIFEAGIIGLLITLLSTSSQARSEENRNLEA